VIAPRASLLAVALILAVACAWRAGAFETTPTRCVDVSIDQINTIVRPAGVDVLNLVGMRPTRGLGSDTLQCEASTMTRDGPLLLRITTLDNRLLVWLAGQARF
jgi:hypothetical protein